jgi:MFS family permease
VAALGTLAVMLDAAVNIAFPAISAAFGVPATAIQGVVLAYVVTFALALLPAGRITDSAGAGAALRAGLALTAGSQLACALAPTWGWLLLARVAQGLGAALVMASAPALVTLTTPARRRGRALGRLGLATSAGGVLGPLLGGFLVGLLGWRVVFWGRAPLAALALGLARRVGLAPDGPGAEPAPGSPALPDPVAGAPAPRDAPARRPPRALAVGPGPLVLANAANLLANAALFAVWLLVPYYLIDRRGFSAGVSGVLFMAGSLAWAVAAPLGGRLADRGAGRWLAPLALAVEGAGLWFTGRLDAAASPLTVAGALALGGFGYGLFHVPNMHYVMSALPPARQGIAGSLVALMRTGGIVVGAALTTRVYGDRLARHAAAGLAPAAAGLAFQDALTAAAGLATVAAALALLVPAGPRGAA